MKNIAKKDNLILLVILFAIQFLLHYFCHLLNRPIYKYKLLTLKGS